MSTPVRKRRTRAQTEAVKAVRRTAAQAGFQLTREQDDSVSHVTQTMAEIDENEDLAQLDGRLTFAERQIDRLATRRDLSDRGIDAELAVMRSRLDETLKAFAAGTQEHKQVVAAAERRLMALASEAERHSRAMLESLRVELTLKLEEAARSTAQLEARLRGEKQAFEEEASRRAGALARSVAQARELLEERIEEATRDLTVRLDAAATQAEAKLASARPADEVRAELMDLLQSSEDKALGAAEHLERIINHVRRRLVGDEAEWSAVVAEAGDAVAALRKRVEDLMERVCSLEANGATDRGASGAHLDAVEQRLELHEEWSQAAIAEVSSQGARLGGVEAQIEALAAVRELAEEQAGAIEYLKSRIHEMEAAPAAPEPVAEAEPDPKVAAPTLEARLDELAGGQARLNRRLDELEERLGTTGNTMRRRVWG